LAQEITNTVCEARLACRYKGHLKMAGERGEPSDYEMLLKEAQERIRDAASAMLTGRHAGAEIPRGLPLDTSLLKRGLPLLLYSTLGDEEISLRFDALIRVNGASLLGHFHYVPVLFHEAERPAPHLRVLLAAFAGLLGPLQGMAPTFGILVYGTACKEKKVKLAGVSKDANRMLRELREAGGGTPPRLVLNGHCQTCEFRRRCHAEAGAKDDLSLLRGMGEAEVAKYAKRGILTVTQLAFTFRPPRRVKKAPDRKPTHSHALQALSIREKKIHVLGTPRLPDSSTRLYLDIEGDPDRGFCYLIGVVVRIGDAQERHSLWIDTPAEERQLLGKFLDLAGGHPDAWVYTYGSYEAAFLRRVGKEAGREEEVGRILGRTFNVLSAIYLHVYFPVHSNGLKDIAGHLGFRWSEPDASGLQSLVWRRRWEEADSPSLKEKLVTYNLEDCDALRRVTEFLYEICPRPASRGQTGLPVAHPVARVEELRPVSSRREWCKADFAVADFAFVNERAYYNYQRDRVFVRTSKTLKRCQARKRRHKGKKNLRANRSAEINCEACPTCGGTGLARTEDGRLARIVYDLRFGRGGVQRRVTRFTTSWHHCSACVTRFLPEAYLRLEEHGHCLKCWAMYKYVSHRATFAGISEEISECFGLPVSVPVAHSFKASLARRYETTYQALLSKIVGGPLIHADETEVRLKGQGKGYVWVFTNLEEVIFMYRKTREGNFLTDLLKGFRGVLVSDFYAAYDSLDCPQQKCLIHLMRDLNNDIQASPWDEELKSLASAFGSLLREVVATIDRHGLKARHLGRHERDVTRFFDSVAGADYRSELADGYRGRMLRNRGTLFTFIKHDGVPWNNNNAEHAVKQFAYYRELADGLFTEKGLSDYLVLLSMRLTCKYKGVSFLKFLLSRQMDIDSFGKNVMGKWLFPALELHSEGPPPRPSRRQTWEKMNRLDEPRSNT
jgi:predicted RecB family nuclease